MITTMNCDFLKTKYFYSSQHSVQGERECIDTLSWLSYGTHERGRNHSTHNESPFSTQPEDPNVSDAQEAPNLIPEVSNTHSSPMSEPIETTNNTSGQANRGVPPKRYSPEKVSRESRYPIANIAKGNLSEEAKAFALSMYYDKIPANTEQALKSKHWKDAMEEEIKALIKNNTWEKRVLPPGKKTVGCRWMFTIKYKPDGTIERYKARLVAKGHTQTYGIDYSETFSPVAKINTIRVLISIAANKGWPLHQFDVKNAFLHGELKEEIYMEAPRGFTDSFGEREVCLLKKSLYGLKQSPRAWFGRFTLAMKHYGFKQSNSDHTLFLKQRGNLITCLIIYVDDMIITGNDKEEITKLKKNLFTEFEMKDLGRLKYFLGIEVLRSKQGIFMYQKKYVLDLLAEIGMVDCKPADTPMIVNQKLYMEKKARLADKGRYQRMVGKLIYLSHTRPDIAHAVGVVSKFMHQPQKAHMKAVLRIIRYLKGTAGHGVLFKQNGHLETQLYTDADWAGDKGDRRSTSGYLTLVGGNLVTWRSKKQKVVALSSAEAEFRGIARGITEVLWIRKLLTEIGYPPQEPSKVMSDNKAAIQISENPSRSAHRILHNLFKSSIQATMSGEATKSGDKLQTFNLHVKANDIKQNKTHLTCGNCGMSRHTTDQCFELIGYPDWWNDGHKKGNKNRGLERGKASAANTGTDRKNSTGLGGMAATTVNEEDGSFSMSTTQNYNINQKQSWIFDCGATDTMTYDLSDFATSTKPTKSYIHTANGEKMNVRNGGTIEISPTLKLSNCLYVPALSHKLLSISHVTKELNCSVIMQPTFCILQDIRTGAIIGRGTERQGLYYVDELTTSGTVMLAHGTSEREAWLWHRRLGHPSGSYLHTLFPKLFPLNKPISCETCILAKSHRQTFKPSNTRVKVPFSLIHSDVWGPAPVIGGQSFRYYVIFVDDCTRMTWIYFLKNKAEVYDRFTAFYAMIQTQFQKSIQVVRSDNGGEYMNSQMNLFFQSKGIVHQTTCPHTPEQNGVAERKNRLLLEMTRALIIESNAPNFFWPEALATATYLINRLPTKILKMKTPLETLSEYHTLPQVLTLEPKVFGCTVFAHIPKSYRDKLDPCVEKCVFCGIWSKSKGI
ncbi:putative RNA-directed DNA polymerase [Tanacetum coccineum]